MENFSIGTCHDSGESAQFLPAPHFLIYKKSTEYSENLPHFVSKTKQDDIA